MTNARQVAANRRNAKKSTGPQSKRGKTLASRNSLKHGLAAKQVVLFDEDPAAFEDLRSDLFELYQPVDPISVHLVQTLAADIWRRRRVPEIEAAIYERGYNDLRNKKGADMSLELYVMKKFPDQYKGTMTEVEEEDEPPPNLGEVFDQSHSSLNSVSTIAGKLDRSIHRAFRELERRKAERQILFSGDSVIDGEAMTVIEASVVDPTKEIQARPKSKTPDIAGKSAGSEADQADASKMPPKRERPRMRK